ncbi:MAG: Hsp20/alpha crystallin family protein [Crenarchaeota archaeon]|nr:Hsp20/alpha crystallin family protein [Thermoproteota archaeon]
MCPTPNRDREPDIGRLVKEVAKVAKDLVGIAVAVPMTIASTMFKSVAARPNWTRFRVSELEDKVVVEVELPGARKESVKVYARRGLLYVKAERDPSIPGEPRSYRVRIEIPEDADTDSAKARYFQGLLVIEIPRALPGREIPVE